MSLPPETLIQSFITAEKLPDSYRAIINDWLLPLATRLPLAQRANHSPLLVGINGAQGTGKSTVSAFLAAYWQREGKQVAILSLDDFYLSHQARERLGRQVHPLLATRGVPGTHDLELLRTVYGELRRNHGGDRLALPRFDKATDNPLPGERWPRARLPVDVVILEGWFTGTPPQPESDLLLPVNDLEAKEDSDGTWRRYANTALAQFQELFAELDVLLMLKAPSFDCVYAWRSLQEAKLAQRAGTDRSGIMDAPALRRFVQLFERLTRHSLATVPGLADVVFELDSSHAIRARHDRRAPHHYSTI